MRLAVPRQVNDRSASLMAAELSRKTMQVCDYLVPLDPFAWD